MRGEAFTQSDERGSIPCIRGGGASLQRRRCVVAEAEVRRGRGGGVSWLTVAERRGRGGGASR